LKERLPRISSASTGELKNLNMKKQLNKQTIGVGVAGTGNIGPAQIEGLRRNGIQVLGLIGSTK
jgi:tRNA A37 threonylcarbamoyladenosine dehydratase